MNPFETSQTPPQKQSNYWLGQVKKVLAFLVVIIFFTGCFKINRGIPITENTTFQEMQKVSLFHGFFVLPMAKLIIYFLKLTNSALIAIIIVTLFNRILGSLLTFKSTIEGEKMKEIQPQIQAINAKYLGVTDRMQIMQKHMEIQALFKKHDLNPMGSIGAMFVSLPLFMGIYVAVKDNVTLGAAKVFGFSATTATKTVVQQQGLSFWIVFIFIALVVFQYLSIKFPTWLSTKRGKKRPNVIVKENPTQRNITIILPLLMLMVGYQVSLALLLYFTISPIFTIFQSYFIHKYIIVKQQKKLNEVNKLY